MFSQLVVKQSDDIRSWTDLRCIYSNVESLFPPAVRLVRKPFQHTGGAGAPPFHGGRRPHHHAALPGTEAQQADHLRSISQLWQVGDGAHWHNHEAQTGRGPVRGGVRGGLEEVQPHGGCEDTKGKKTGWKREMIGLICACLLLLIHLTVWGKDVWQYASSPVEIFWDLLSSHNNCQ